MVGPRGEAQKTLSISRYSRPKIANSGLFYTSQVLQNKKFATAKDSMIDHQLVDKCCYFQIEFTYTNSYIFTICIMLHTKQFFVVLF